jgi:hypothetical protein
MNLIAELKECSRIILRIAKKIINGNAPKDLKTWAYKVIHEEKECLKKYYEWQH